MNFKLLLSFCVAAAALPGIATAAVDSSVNVPPEEASKSVPELARQEGIQIVAPVDQLQGIMTPAANGTMDVNQALSDLLAGAGLKVAQNDGKTIILRGVSTAADVMQAPAGDAAGAAPTGPVQTIDTVTVTGSRVISDIQASPTPVTIVTLEQLQLTTPSDIPDGLNKLPVFGGSNVPRLAGNGAGGTNSSGGVPENVLNLRNFGDQRTLVLLDGHRASPSNADGSVDIDTLPQMLVSRVDVVTGGASAVYGSDAITGVVNFILDKHFDGLKFDVNGGISPDYGDAASIRLGVAYGTDLFDGHAHFEGSLRHFQQDMVPASSRPFGGLQITQQGGGTLANPDVNVLNTRKLDSPFGGKIAACVPACALANGMQFVTDGVLGPFNAGAPVGTPASTTVASGGDGGYNKFGSAQSGIRQDEAFSRFSYDIDSDTVFYVQGTAAASYSDGVWFPVKISPSITAGSGGNGVGIYYKNNAFLSPAVQTALGNNGTNAPEVGATQPNNTFGLGEYVTSTGASGFVGTRNYNRNLSVTTGLDGTVFGDFSWDAYYTHGETRQSVDNLNNTNSQNLFAASDAVLNGAGVPVCYASTQAATATQYANCVPINPFGPTAVSQAAENYFTQTTFYHETNILDDVGAGISGTVLDDWAGPIKAALSAEGRFNQLSVVSNASPTAKVDCTGLRICNSTSLLWIQNAVAPISASNNVWEVAGEADVPLLKDSPLAEHLDLNLAGRYTDYSTSGSVQTWKIGVNWQVDDSVRLRGTNSVDIRAPTLTDLFAPASTGSTSFTDLYPTFATPPGPPTSGTTVTLSQGNPNLVPEVSRTYTGGIVVTPDFIPGLTASFDYYFINIKNAISSLSGGNGTGSAATYQTLCFNSGGTSPLCDLFQRPLGNTNTTAANFPTADFSRGINASVAEVEGWDFETDYGWQMSDVVADWKGSWTARLLVNYQPVNETIQLPGVTNPSWAGAPKTHITAFLHYTLDDNWSMGLEDRWLGGFSKVLTLPAIVYAQPHVHSVNYLDLDLERKFEFEGGKFEAYLTAQNVLNAQSDVYVTSGSVGLNYPIPFGQDVIGRYLTLGMRANL